MKEKENNEVAIYEKIRTEIRIADREAYKVPMAAVFGKGTLAGTKSFGGKSLVENSQLVDAAIQNTDELQNIWNHLLQFFCQNFISVYGVATFQIPQA